MKTQHFFAIAALAIATMVAMPATAQSHKDKKAAKKEKWEMEQRQQREEAELRHKLRMDSIANAKKTADEQAAKAEAERREKEAEERARQKKAEEQAGLVEQDYEEPCSELKSTVDLLRGFGVGEDLDHQFSSDLARTAALENMASQISTNVKSLLTRNRKQGKQGLSRGSLQKTEDMVITEIEQALNYRVACKKTRTFTENGVRVFKTYMVVEMPADGLLQSIFDSMQQDEELQMDMDFDEFKKEFNENFSGR